MMCFLLLLCLYSVYSCHVSTVLCYITVLWTPDNERILPFVLQLYERNKLKDFNDFWHVRY